MRRKREHFAQRLRAAGLRVTPQRRAVWSAFEGETDGHLTADEVFRRARRELPELSRATVYNTLAALVDVELLMAVESRGIVLYDPNTDPSHHHFRCQSCDLLYDVHLEGLEDLRLSGEHGFLVYQTTVLLEGLCPACSARQSARRRD
jgi:Fe2+ or Zn2+ uptake regulation protein